MASSYFPSSSFYHRFHIIRKVGSVGMATAVASVVFQNRQDSGVQSHSLAGSTDNNARVDRAPWCLVPFSFLGSALAEGLSESAVLKEFKTGTSFPIQLHNGVQQHIAGVGLRRKRLFGLKNIDVYAFGVYANEASLKDQLGSKYGQVSETALKECKDFYNDIVASDIYMTVRLVIVYGRLNISSVRSAFEESIGSRIKKFSGTENRPLLERFTKIFSDDIKIPRWTTIDITRCPGHNLQTKINGLEVGSIESSLLCRAFFDLYIGDNPFDAKGKEDIISKLASLVRD